MDSSILIIDVREPFEFSGGHAKGALNIPPSELMSGAKQLNSTPRDTKLVVYCKTGSRSNVAIQILKQQGFTNLVNGINADHVTKNYLN